MKKTYLRLTEEQKNEIVAMNQTGKSASEICAVLSDKYKASFSLAKVYYTLKHSDGPIKKGKKGKNGKKGSKDIQVQNTVAEILDLFMRTERANEAIFNYLRTKLIVNLWEKHKVMKKESIVIIPGDELTPEQEAAATKYLEELI